MSFIQIIEFTTDSIDQLNAMLDEWRDQNSDMQGGPVRATQTRSRDHADTYFQILEFESYEAAMANSNRPETAEFAQRMAKLCTGQPVFHNLDVLREFSR